MPYFVPFFVLPGVAFSNSSIVVICSSLLLSLRLINIQNILSCVFTMEFPRVENARNSKINRTELGREYVNTMTSFSFNSSAKRFSPAAIVSYGKIF